MKIRPAAAADLAAMNAIYGWYVENTAVTFEYTPPTEAEYAARFARISADYPWLVLEEEGKILGFAYADRAFEKAAYAWCADMTVYLAPEAAGQGRGRALYLALEELLKARGIRILYALVTASNEVSLRFHEAMGYRQVGFLRDAGWKQGRWHSVAWMEKRLGGLEAPKKLL